MTNLKKILKQNVLFIMYSSIGTLADIGILNILSIIMDKRIANMISYCIGVIIAFFLCRSFVFKTKDHTTKRLLSTIYIHFIGLIIQELLLDFLLKRGIDLNVAKLITIGENAIIMYFLNVFIVFRKYKTRKKKVSDV